MVRKDRSIQQQDSEAGVDVLVGGYGSRGKERHIQPHDREAGVGARTGWYGILAWVGGAFNRTIVSLEWVLGCGDLG